MGLQGCLGQVVFHQSREVVALVVLGQVVFQQSREDVALGAFSASSSN